MMKISFYKLKMVNYDVSLYCYEIEITNIDRIPIFPPLIWHYQSFVTIVVIQGNLFALEI